MNLGVKAQELLLELKRSEFIPPWNEDGMRGVLQEITALSDEIQDTMDDREIEELPRPVQVGVMVHHQALLRNKRCLLAYVNHRAAVMRELRWEMGPVLPTRFSDNLSMHEKEYFSKYDGLLASHNLLVGLDLTADARPPKEVMIEIRVVEECGELMTDQGALNLEKGSTHLVRRSHVEHLIRQGKLTQLDNETTI